MNRHLIWLKRFAYLPVLLWAALGAGGECIAAPLTEPGRLFYTPEQRAQLEAARARNVTEVRQPGPAAAPRPVRFDGMVIRSDGNSTRWINGQPQAGASGVSGLKPGQIRANGRVYEPYQVLRPGPDPAIAKEPTP